MPDPAATFADIARVLRPGGTLAVAGRTGDQPLPAWMDPDVYRIPTADQVVSMLAAAGYGPIDHHVVDRGDHTLHLFAAHLSEATRPA